MDCIDQKTGDGWTLYNGDCIELIKGLPSESIHFSIFSPPFASLYTYSASERDMGNCVGEAEFLQHFKFLTPELFRVTKPGRLLSFHCMNLPLSKERDGFIGIRDFRGNLIKAFQEACWIFHSEVCIWKDPLLAAVRTKALGLLHKQLIKDSAMSRQGIPDYLVTMRKPGVNEEPISKKPRGFERFVGENPPKAEKTNDPAGNKYSHLVWQRYASPVWMDINPTETLQAIAEEKDERHICPLQLQVIERALELWTNKGDVVLSPFAGIGSEGDRAIITERRFIGIELKAAYFQQAALNLARAEKNRAQLTLSPMFGESA